MSDIVLLAGAVLVVAFLYSIVGHAGASGYIAVMTLFGLAPTLIRPTALTLNILVAALAAWQFWRAGHFSWSLFWPFASLSLPFAFIGGALTLPVPAFKILIGIVLLFSAARFLVSPGPDRATHPPARSVALPVGAALGFLSGITGVGGGIFLTPLVIEMRWARTQTAAAVSALFILVNSCAGLAGNIVATSQLPVFALPLAAAALVGGAFGSYAGSHRFSVSAIKRVLAVVLMVAGVKLIFT